jgi:hypothetical protein
MGVLWPVSQDIMDTIMVCMLFPSASLGAASPPEGGSCLPVEAKSCPPLCGMGWQGVLGQVTRC